jgi:hypothetical protein
MVRDPGSDFSSESVTVLCIPLCIPIFPPHILIDPLIFFPTFEKWPNGRKVFSEVQNLSVYLSRGHPSAMPNSKGVGINNVSSPQQQNVGHIVM